MFLSCFEQEPFVRVYTLETMAIFLSVYAAMCCWFHRRNVRWPTLFKRLSLHKEFNGRREEGPFFNDPVYCAHRHGLKERSLLMSPTNLGKAIVAKRVRGGEGGGCPFRINEEACGTWERMRVAAWLRLPALYCCSYVHGRTHN